MAPITDVLGKIFYSQMSTVSYIPQAISIQAIVSIPLKSTLNSCQITSSVNNAQVPSALTPGGWKTEYKPHQFYTSGSCFLTIAFGNLTHITKLTITQYFSTAITTPFSKFQIAYSNDNVSYAYLPEVIFFYSSFLFMKVKIFIFFKKASYPVAQIPTPFTYAIPNGYITCRFLRIIVTGIATPSDLASKVTGLVINEIYGMPNTTDRSLASMKF